MCQPILIVFLLTLSLTCFGQRQQLHGKLSGNSTILDDVYIVNLQSEGGAITSSGGYFVIPARPGDTLMISAINIIAKKVTVTQGDFGEDLLFIKVQPNTNLLDEVTVNEYRHINAVALGLISKKPPQYTAAERKFKSGGDYNAMIGTNSSVSGDAILNAISGRRAMLKKELSVERKELLVEKIGTWFDDAFFTDDLKIPKDYISGFKLFIVEDRFIVNALQSSNKMMSKLLMTALSVKYNNLISKELSE